MAQMGESSCCRFAQADPEIVAQIVCTYSDALVRFAYSYVKDSAAAEDVAGDAVALLFVKKKRFENEQKLRAWLYKSVRSKAIDYLRRHKKYVPLEDVENVLCTHSTEDEILRRQRDETVYKCINRLPECYQTVILLTYFEGFSLEVARHIMGKNVKQMYNIHARAKIALRELLEKEGITHEDL